MNSNPNEPTLRERLREIECKEGPLKDLLRQFCPVCNGNGGWFVEAPSGDRYLTIPFGSEDSYEWERCGECKDD